MVTKEMLKNFRGDFASTVADLEKKYNIKINMGNISFTPTSFKTKLEVASLSAEDVQEKTETVNSYADMMAHVNGVKFKGNLIGSMYVVAGKRLTVTDFQSRKSKYPVICRDTSGKAFKVSFDHLKLATLL